MKGWVSIRSSLTIDFHSPPANDIAFQVLLTAPPPANSLHHPTRAPCHDRGMQRDITLTQLITRHEGRRTHPYTDTVGNLTIGVGRNLTDRGLSGDEIDYLLANDIAIADAVCTDLFGWRVFRNASKPRQYALISMAFNMGGPRLAGFANMIAAVRAGDWNRAADEALDSRWARQVGTRATEIAAMLREGWVEPVNCHPSSALEKSFFARVF